VAGAGDNSDSSSKESVADENVRQVCFLAGVVRTNEDYGLGNLVVLPDPDTATPATFKAVEPLSGDNLACT
jgi:hypothetical protein